MPIQPTSIGGIWRTNTRYARRWLQQFLSIVNVGRWGRSFGAVWQDNIVMLIGSLVGTSAIGAVHLKNVKIPQGATIQSAILSFTTDSSIGAGAQAATVDLEDTDNASLITTANLPASWTLTGTGSTYDISAFPVVYKLNVAVPLQAIINRPGWNSGNAINLSIADPVGGSNATQITPDSARQFTLKVKFKK